MTDYFKDICDWKDADERFVLQDEALARGGGTITIRGTQYPYRWIQRYWRVAGNTSEQNRALGLMFELKLATGEINYNGTRRHLVSWGKTLEEAVSRVELSVCLWLDKKNSTSSLDKQ